MKTKRKERKYDTFRNYPIAFPSNVIKEHKFIIMVTTASDLLCLLKDLTTNNRLKIALVWIISKSQNYIQLFNRSTLFRDASSQNI